MAGTRDKGRVKGERQNPSLIPPEGGTFQGEGLLKGHG